MTGGIDDDGHRFHVSAEVPKPTGTRKWFERSLLWLGFTLSAAGLIVLAFSFVHPVERGIWDPLGNYPSPQHVTNGPRISLSSTVDSTGVKCAKTVTTVRGVKFWQSEDPHGALVLDGYGVSTKPEGCRTVDFKNVIPNAVASLVRSGGPQVWHIVGTDTPIRSSGEQGVPRSWQTDAFTLVP